MRSPDDSEDSSSEVDSDDDDDGLERNAVSSKRAAGRADRFKNPESCSNAKDAFFRGPNDFERLRNAAILHGKVKDATGTETWIFVFRNELESERAFRDIIHGDTSLSKREGDKKVVGGFIKALASLETVFEHSGSSAEFSEAKAGIEVAKAEMKRLHSERGIDVSDEAYAWLEWKKNNKTNSISRLDAAARNGAFGPLEEGYTKDLIGAIMKKNSKCEKLTLREQLHCRIEQRWKRQVSSSNQALVKKVGACGNLIHDFKQFRLLMKGILERKCLQCERHTSLWGQDFTVHQRSAMGGALKASCLHEIDGVDVNDFTVIERAGKHICDVFQSFEHEGCSNRFEIGGNEQVATAMSSAPPQVEASSVRAQRSSSSSSSSRETSTGSSSAQRNASAPPEEKRPVSLSPEIIQGAMDACERQLAIIESFCEDHEILVPEARNQFIFRSKIGQRIKDKNYRHGCNALIVRRTFEDDEICMISVCFMGEGNLSVHSCGIEDKPWEQRLPLDVRESINHSLRQGVPPMIIMRNIRNQYVADREDGISKSGANYRVTRRQIYNIMDQFGSGWKLAKVDEEDVAKRVEKDQNSATPVVKAYKPYKVRPEDERCHGLEGLNDPPDFEDFFLAIADEEMVEMLRAHGSIIYWDSTHNISRKAGIKLVTIMVADDKTGRGHFVLWVVTNTETTEFYERVFTVLKRLHGDDDWKPDACMCDMAPAPVSAVKTVLRKPEMPIMYCA